MRARFSLVLFALVVGLAGALGCDDEAGGDGTDLGTDVPPDVTEDAGPEATPDLADEPDAPTFEPTETEPNGLRDPEPITIPTVIRGVIGAPGTSADLDAFAFTATAGTILRLTLLRDNIDSWIIVDNFEPGGPETFRLLADDTQGLTRELFIPADGEYVLSVEDGRNVDWAFTGEGDPVGGDELIYELAIELDTATPEAVTLPVSESNDDLPGENDVRILEFAVTESDIGSLLVVDLDAETLDPPSELDPAVVLMNADLTRMLAENDDENFDANRYDSLLRYEVEAAATLNLVLDFFSAGEDNAHDVTVVLSDPGQELEPNNDGATAWRIAVTAPEDEPAPVAGVIGAPIEATAPGVSDIPDEDFYALGEMAEGDAVELTVTLGEASELQARLLFGIELQGLFVPLMSALAGPDGVARLEATALFDPEDFDPDDFDGRHFAVVADQRNFPPPGASASFVLDAVGGDTFTYGITAKRFTRTPTDLGTTFPIDVPDAALSQTGEVDWYTFGTAADAGGILLISLTTEVFDPTMALYDRRRSPPVGELTEEGDISLVVNDVAPDADYALAVLNMGQWPAAEVPASYALSIELLNASSGLTVVEEEETDFPDDVGSARAVTETRAQFRGTVPGTDEVDHDSDVFSLDLIAGQRLHIETFGTIDEVTDPGPTDPVNADTVLTLTSEQLAEDIRNDDFGGPFSRIVHDVEAAGTYFVTLEPYCDEEVGCLGGHYGLNVLVIGP